MQLAAGQRWLQDIRSVDRAFRAASPDQGVQFIDKEDDIAGLTNFVHDFFQAVLKFAAVFRTGNDGAHIQRHHAFVA
ncbi:hypothetical protein D3C73_1528150 [compost metagenome]